MSLTMTATYTLVDCPRAGCGMTFGVPKTFEHNRRDDHTTFYCPNGHPMSFRQDSEAEKLRRENARLTRDRDWYAAEQKKEMRRAAAARGQVTKMRNRIANGVCPAPGCKRSGFVDVAHHLATCHPDFHAHEVTT